jgi:hypothetical protein
MPLALIARKALESNQASGEEDPQSVVALISLERFGI